MSRAATYVARADARADGSVAGRAAVDAVEVVDAVGVGLARRDDRIEAAGVARAGVGVEHRAEAIDAGLVRVRRWVGAAGCRARGLTERAAVVRHGVD